MVWVSDLKSPLLSIVGGHFISPDHFTPTKVKADHLPPLSASNHENDCPSKKKVNFFRPDGSIGV
jgi:hypothetical protein